MANKAGKARCALNACDKNGKKREVWVFIDRGREFYSIFCRKHGCAALTRQQSGDDRTEWIVCTAVRLSDDTRYCEIHDRCNKDGCLKKRDTSFNHHKDRPLCSDHKCLNTSCKNERSDNSGYCETHRAICHKMPGCLNKVTKNGNFCEQHTCQQKLCLKFAGSRWCDDHTPCDAAFCNNPKVGRGDGAHAHPYGADHVPKPCALYQDHRLDRRQVLAPPGETFCDRHRCREHGCSQHRVEQEASGYCKTHKCGEPKCPQPISHSGVVTSTYCHNHECSYREGNVVCQKLKGQNDLSCKEHECGYSGCPEMISPNLAMQGQKRCENHTDRMVALMEENAALKKREADTVKMKANEEEKRKREELERSQKKTLEKLLDERDKVQKKLDEALREKENALAERDRVKKELEVELERQKEEAERNRKAVEEAHRDKAAANEARIKTLTEQVEELTKKLEAQKPTTELPDIRVPGSDMGRHNDLLGLGYGLSVIRGPPTESGYGGSDTHNIALPAGTKKFTLEMSETDEGPAVDKRAKVEARAQRWAN